MTKEEFERIKKDRQAEKDYICKQPYKSHVIDQLIIALERAWAEGGNAKQERDEGCGYLFRLLATVAPSCQPLDTVLGVATQVDNYIAGLRQERDDLKRQHKDCLEQKEALRERTEALELGYRGFP